MAAGALLSLRGLTVARGGIEVLSGLDLDVTAGEAVILRGPNGIGKTTLLRSMAGLQPARAGRVEVDAETLVYAGHADGVKPTLSVTENLTFWADVFGIKEIGPALTAFELKALAERPAGALSAGQRRRLGLARLLVTGRRLWLLDEPTVSLDTDAVGMFARAVETHLATGGAAVIATHIELGLAQARVVELSPFKAVLPDVDDFDEAFA